ncbi:MAG TPA: FIST N-terminal domain-containing protein [Candidatus Limnocylindrales bacterium]|nr:FIST N-terminal domain-containing protein [Candidatus Limnocylindrales bacterium]
MIKKESKNKIIKKNTAVVFTNIADEIAAGKSIADQIKESMGSLSPDAIIVFASSKYNYTKLLTTIKKNSKPKLLVGCSSAGEFISKSQGEGAVSAVALRSDEMSFAVGIGHGINKNVEKAARDVVATFKGMKNHTYPYRTSLVLADALAGYTDTLIDQMNQLTGGIYQFFGGGAGDDAKFSKTHVFMDTEVFTNAVVALEILSKKPVGIGIRHGWEPTGELMRVTESKGMKIISLNATKTIDVVKAYAKKTGQTLDLSDPIPFFLHNVIGIKTVDGFKLRVPLAINKDGSIQYASDIPTGAIVSFMKTTAASAVKAAQDATNDALSQVNVNDSHVAFVFDCVATRLRTGREFKSELNAIDDKLGKNTQFVGCNTYGQISRVDGQFNGFHNCTAVVCVISS